MDELMRLVAQIAIAQNVEAYCRARMGLHMHNELFPLWQAAYERAKTTRQSLEKAVWEKESQFKKEGLS